MPISWWTMAMATKRAELHLYLFGASSGESIVIQLPDRSWAVIDCFATSSKDVRTNPAHDLLKSRGVRELAFLCLTHPHADHFTGMSRLVRDFQIRKFWGFGGLQPPDFDLLKSFFQADAATSSNRLDADAREGAAEISELFDGILSQVPSTQAVSAKTLIYPESVDKRSSVRIWGLAPSGRHTDEYKRCLVKSFARKRFKSALPGADHNLISSALLIQFGRTRIILGGDVENEGWQHVLDDKPVDDLSAHAVKVSHHGSKNGFCLGLWDRFSAGSKPVAILTPFASKALPQREALDHIQARASSIHSAAVLRHDESSFPTAPDPSFTRIRAMLAAKARARLSGSGRKGGACHLIFDNRGHFTLEHEGEAGRIA